MSVFQYCFSFPHREVNQSSAFSFSCSFPYLLPMNNSEPHNGCHKYHTQHCINSCKLSDTSHPSTYLDFPSPATQACFIFLFPSNTDSLAKDTLQNIWVQVEILPLRLGPWPPISRRDLTTGTCWPACSHNPELH